MYLKSGNFWLFLILSLNFWLVPISQLGTTQDLNEDLFAEGLLLITLLVAVAIQGFNAPHYRKWAVLACLVILAAMVIEEMMPMVKYIDNTVFAVSFAVTTMLYFHTMTDSLERVTFDTVLAAACTYVMIGFFFAAVLGLVAEFDPNAFTQDGASLPRHDMLYYSFATLTTLGAADILPVSDLAKMMTVAEAVVGLIYIAILVGAVVGSYSARLSGR